MQQPLPDHRMEIAVQRALDQVVKISRPDGGSGTGMYMPGNHILTCLHVVDGAQGLYVRFRTGEQVEADVQSAEPANDLAMLVLRSSPASIAPDRMAGIRVEHPVMEPGEALAAIGHPLGLDWSVTGGHFNAVRQPGEDPLPRFGINLTTPLVQVDVAINPGNSGGPIIDLDGTLVGIADSIINPALANNIGFAIAAETVLSFWQTHQHDTGIMSPYNCGHHHAQGETFCPTTGKPIKPRESVPMPEVGAVRYSCGHAHAPGLTYCPLTGKPVKELTAMAAADESGEATLTDQAGQPPLAVMAACSNCGFTFAATMSACPQCGKPRRK